MADEMVEKVYTFVHTFIHEQGFSPSLREIAEGCYINIVYAIRYLDILEAQGRITRKRGQPRSIRLSKEC